MDPWLLLAVAESAGPGLCAPLLDPDLDPERALRDPPRVPPAVRERLRDTRRLLDGAQRWQAAAVDAGLAVLTPGCPGYPEVLRGQALRPLALFVRGDPGALAPSPPPIAVVGSRTPTAYGTLAAEDFAGALARAGLPVWSGLALGVDAIAHRACLDAGAPTVAVLAGGLDRVYPAENTSLAERLLARGGALVSEQPPGMAPRRGHYPRRNRLLAQMCTAVLVVEAGLRSGTMHTARFAAELGTPLYAVPGPYTSPRSRGCHRLLADGAGLAADPGELLRDLGLECPQVGACLTAAGPDAAAILEVLNAGPRPTALVQQEAGLSRDAFLAALLQLESTGTIRRLAGDLLGLAPGGALPPASR